MATVSITNDLKPYLASLRAYLNREANAEASSREGNPNRSNDQSGPGEMNTHTTTGDGVLRYMEDQGFRLGKQQPGEPPPVERRQTLSSFSLSTKKD